MKAFPRLLFLTLLFVSVPICAFAQSEWRLEILGGINSGAINPNPYFNNYESPLSPSGEIIIEKNFGSFWSLGVGGEFVQREVHETDQEPSRNSIDPGFYLDSYYFDDIQKLNYFEFPLTLKFRLNFGPVRPFAFAGVSPGFFLSGSNHIHFWDFAFSRPTDTTFHDETYDARSGVNSFFLSLTAGIGVSYEISPHISVLAQANYEPGLTNISNGSIAANQSQQNGDSPFYLPGFTPLYYKNLITTDFRIQAGVAIAL